ncbi:heterokaryon incompatibility protein-domain-containing protein [Neurospora crassa]|nr:heterokaryon incompatibility protein-domain-containing protein [Neurospora crassa]
MRLLKTDTFELVEFVGEEIPKYAILSHTWEGKEVSLQDIQHPDAPIRLKADKLPTPAWAKVKHACRQARRDKFEFIWIDTCCIDKSSSAELQEAINSMFAWYRKSALCYAFLSDVRKPSGSTDPSSFDITRSRWFTRGWTLQELLAPDFLYFYDASWELSGSRSDWAESISKATTIPVDCLAGPEYGQGDVYSQEKNGSLVRTPETRKSIEEKLQQTTVAARMSWAANRHTTRVEDQAYCLLGLFDINMPMLYGEGKKAFMRLQQEIMKTYDDATILAWGYGMPLDRDTYVDTADGYAAHDPELYRRHLRYQACKLRPRPLLATSPADFRFAGNLKRYNGSPSLPLEFAISQRGLMLDGLWGFDTRYCLQYLFLPCTDADRILALPMLYLLSIYRSQASHDRTLANTLCVPIVTTDAGKITTHYRDFLSSVKREKYYLMDSYNAWTLRPIPGGDRFFNTRTLEMAFRKEPPWPGQDNSKFDVEMIYPPLSRQPHRFVILRTATAPKATKADAYEADRRSNRWTNHGWQPSETPSHSLLFILNIDGKRILLVLGMWSGGKVPRSLACHSAILGAKELVNPTLTELNSLSKEFSTVDRRVSFFMLQLAASEPYINFKLQPGLELWVRWCRS